MSQTMMSRIWGVAHLGCRASGVSRIWRAFGLQPHRSEPFKLSRDPDFVDKARDVVGPCLNPPDRALALCVDEKPHIQAVEGAAPVLPMRAAHARCPCAPARSSGTPTTTSATVPPTCSPLST